MTAPETTALLRLLSWFSPAFPVGAYAYSHGLEKAVEAGRVTDRASLTDWLEAELRWGGGRNDGVFFAQAWRAAQRRDMAALRAAADLAAAMRSTAEFALESAAQGAAFLAVARRAWPCPLLDALAEQAEQRALAVVLPIAAGATCAAHGVDLDPAATACLQAWTANLIGAGVRLIPLGQTDGQLAVAALETAVLDVAREVCASSLDDAGSAAFMADIGSMQHETQYTRLFRS